MVIQTANKVLSVQETAYRLGVHVTTIYRWCAIGAFVPKIMLGEHRVGFESEDVEAWLLSRRLETADA